MRFGMDLDSIDPQGKAGVTPDYGMIWIGPWTLRYGWGGTDAAFARAESAGVTPVIQFYYWGDDISINCLENGCWSNLHGATKNRTNWQLLATQLAEHLNQKLGGAAALIIVESEFNKNDAGAYEPLDGYLAEKAAFFHRAYAASQVVLGFGNWADWNWKVFDRAATAADLLGLQAMRGSTRDSAARYEGVLDATLYGARTLRQLFQKPLIITDLALSSYPEPDYATRQAKVIDSLFARMGEFKALEVRGLLYRSFYDSPGMSTANYFGEAERHWGLAWAGNGTAKPALASWIKGVQAERAPPVAATTTTTAPTTTTAAPTTTPATTPPPTTTSTKPAFFQAEAERFATKTAGAQEPDAQASAGARWNLWANGHLQQSFNVASAGEYGVLVWARGQPLAGVLPHMVVSVDGEVLLQADPGSGTFQAYGSPTAIAAGDHVVKVAFTNDARNGHEDRNLLLDRVVIQPLQRVEGEHFSSRSVGGVQPDSTASGGQRWNLWSPGSIGHRLDAPASGDYDLRVRSQGQTFAGIKPHMVVSVDGKVVREADPAPGGWADLSIKVPALAAGSHEVRIQFTNDASNAYEDRNLLIDRIELVRSG
ncbi:MAG TPA: carbohydrate-binding domain-containing protein [Candidatus Thermoplasmatota archaeon]|nr:carbohydrate-binding domain-containing protein [Candidatus Thermoplasmatota archaeon]